jgi:hypothetical protein
VKSGFVRKEEILASISGCCSSEKENYSRSCKYIETYRVVTGGKENQLKMLGAH